MKGRKRSGSPSCKKKSRRARVRVRGCVDELAARKRGGIVTNSAEAERAPLVIPPSNHLNSRSADRSKENTVQGASDTASICFCPRRLLRLSKSTWKTTWLAMPPNHRNYIEMISAGRPMPIRQDAKTCGGISFPGWRPPPQHDKSLAPICLCSGFIGHRGLEMGWR